MSSNIDVNPESDPRELESFKMTAKASIEAHKRMGRDVVIMNPQPSQEQPVLAYFEKRANLGKPGYATEGEAVSIDDPRAIDLVAKELMRAERRKQSESK
ncbi:MAG: hypothetical protein HY397_01790 [Candidatus Doudnabacteria bacterium]|nr:hypothetical protein [Candidatus Doudnabacteria bacterium]